MKYSKSLPLILAALFALLWTSPVLACWGFRPMGMGGTFVAVADDANAAYWNRAGFGQLAGFRDGESQIIYTGSVYTSSGFFSRKGRVGNPYYDSINYANKLDDSMGWGLAAAYNGGTSFDFSPGFGFRLPDFGIDLLKNQSLGIGYFLWRQETVGQMGGSTVDFDVTHQQIHLDYLWRPVKEFSFGVHIEKFWEFAYNITIPSTGQSQSGSFGILDHANIRPSIAWWITPDWIFNAGAYDLLNGSGIGPFFSLGSEYKWNNMAFRGGLYNLGGSVNMGLITLGYSYWLNQGFEIGSWVGIPTANAAPDKWMVNLGIACNF